MSSKKALVSALCLAASAGMWAQSSTNSPYTRYGLGDTFDYIFANNAAMGGVGYALRTSQHINPMNPASYTAVDSLSFMFDTGMTLKSSNYQEGNYKSNAKNSSFDYLAMQFRLHPRIATVIGYTPFSTVGYNFSRTKDIAGSDVAVTNNFYGDGDLRQIFGGVGFKILDNLSVGANVGYLYGKLNYQTTASLSNGGDQSIIYNKVDVSSYNLNFGLQYTRQLDKGHELTVGLAYGLGHVLNVTDTHGTQVTDGSTYSSVNEQSTENAYGIPHTFGAGLAWKYKNNLTVEADYTLQKWEGVKYGNSTGLYKNRSKIALGAEWLPKEFGRSYLARIKYRAGAYYSTPYVTTPSADPYGARIRRERGARPAAEPVSKKQRAEHHGAVRARQPFRKRTAIGKPLRAQNRTDIQRTLVHEMESQLNANELYDETYHKELCAGILHAGLLLYALLRLRTRGGQHALRRLYRPLHETSRRRKARPSLHSLGNRVQRSAAGTERDV